MEILAIRLMLAASTDDVFWLIHMRIGIEECQNLNLFTSCLRCGGVYPKAGRSEQRPVDLRRR